MNAFIKFNKGLMKYPMQWKMWLMLLVGANMVIPFFFLDRLEAQVALGTIMLSIMLMTAITHFTGFTRLLGLGHVFWFPMLYFFWTRLSQIPADDFFGIWLRALMVINAVSLVIDVADVVRYITGDRLETITRL
ncbi:hypothetical protein JYT87_03585 [Nitrospira defluvii]|nr:hypothetical protein [Nitrospira defluvii]